MVDAEKPVPPVELSGGMARILLAPEDVPAFQDWQRLTKHEKESLIWMAEHHPYIMQMVNAWRWASQGLWGVVRLGAIAAAVLGLMSLYNYWKGL